MIDVVVIGAGIGGLAAAIELGAEGRRVLVLEARDDVGGKAGRARIEGAEVDTGPSLLTMPDVFDALLQRAGSSLREECELLAPERLFEYRWADGRRLVVRHALEDTLREVRATFGESAERELRSYLAHAKRIWEAASPSFVLGEAPSVRGLARLGPRAIPMLAAIEPLRTMRASIRARVREPHLVTLLERYATYNGSDPRSAPATLGCIAHVELGMGGFGVRGGVHALVRALARAARRLGAEIRTGARVARVELERGRVRGVVLEGGEAIACDVVVANADPAHVLGGLVEGVRPPAGAPSMSGWTAIVKARRRPGRAPHLVLFPRDYEEELRDVHDRGRPPGDPTLYVCAQGAAHGRAGWSEHEALFVMVNAPAEPASGASPEAWWRDVRDVVVRRLRAHDVVEAGDGIVWERSPRELAAAFPGTRGAIYGTSSSSIASAFLRPANEVREVPGLYLASGGAHPGGGMPLAALSGRAAAAAIARRRVAGSATWTRGRAGQRVEAVNDRG